MFRNVLIAIVLCTRPVTADGYLADAFGIVPTDQQSVERAHWAGVRTTATATEIKAAETARTSLFFLGPKSVVAGIEELHAVALVLDRHGNLASDDTPVNFTLNGVQLSGSAPEYGIGEHIHRPAPIAGSYVGAAQVKNVQSQRAMFRVTSDLGSVALQLTPPPRAIPIETLVRFESQPMQDRYGNHVEDGTGAEFLLRHTDGRVSQMAANVVDGVARSWFLARDVDKGGGLQPAMAASVAQAAPVHLERLVASHPTEVLLWPAPHIGAVNLRAGPFLTSAGHLLNDGAPLQVSVTEHAGKSVVQSGWIRDGHIEMSLPLSPENAPYTVELHSVLGTERRAGVMLSATAPQPVRSPE